MQTALRQTNGRLSGQRDAAGRLGRICPTRLLRLKKLASICPASSPGSSNYSAKSLLYELSADQSAGTNCSEQTKQAHHQRRKAGRKNAGQNHGQPGHGPLLFAFHECCGRALGMGHRPQGQPPGHGVADADAAQ